MNKFLALMVVCASIFTGCAVTVQPGNLPEMTVEPTTEAATESSVPFVPAVILTPEDTITVDAVPTPGELTVIAGEHPSSNIIVGGTNEWSTVAQHCVIATGENVTINSLTIHGHGDAASNHRFAVSYDGAIVGQDIFPVGVNQSRRVELTTPFTALAGMQTCFRLLAMPEAVIPTAAIAGGRRDDVPLSGNEIALGVGAIEGLGETSGQSISTSLPAPLMGNIFVVRKTNIVVVQQPITSTTLTNGSQQELLKLQVSSSGTRAAALKKITFSITCNEGSSIQLSNFGLRRGSSELTTDVRIMTEAGLELRDATVACNTNVVVIFMDDQIITGSGQVFTLLATPSNVVAGNTLETSLAHSHDLPTVTGHLSTDRLHIETAASLASDSFIWSDLSEVPHDNTSNDWIGESLINLTATQRLTR